MVPISEDEFDLLKKFIFDSLNDEGYEETLSGQDVMIAVQDLKYEDFLQWLN